MNRTDCSTRNHLPAYCECDMADLDKRISGERTSEIASLRESNAHLLEALRMIADLTDENLERFGPQSANATIDEWARAAIAAEGEKP